MNATKLSDIQFLANEYDDGNYVNGIVISMIK